MKRRVELIYDANCPQVGEARAALLAAFAQCELPALWSEWDRGDPHAPSYVRSCGSPTILVDGRDVDRPPSSAGAGYCRLYETVGGGLSGAPSVDLIAAALGRSRGERRWPVLAAAAPAALVAALPTCPLCRPLYAGALSAVSLGFLLNREHTPLLAVVLLLLTLLPLVYTARVHHLYGPVLVGVFGSGAVLLGKLLLASDVALYAGLATLLAAYGWNIRRRDGKNCSRCETA
jgi:hypothetical protein